MIIIILLPYIPALIALIIVPLIISIHTDRPLMVDTVLTVTLLPIIIILLIPAIPVMDMGYHMAAILIQAIITAAIPFMVNPYLIISAIPISVPTLIIMVLILDITAMAPVLDMGPHPLAAISIMAMALPMVASVVRDILVGVALHMEVTVLVGLGSDNLNYKLTGSFILNNRFI